MWKNIVSTRAGNFFVQTSCRIDLNIDLPQQRFRYHDTGKYANQPGIYSWCGAHFVSITLSVYPLLLRRMPYQYHVNSQFCSRSSTDYAQARKSNISPPSAFLNTQWGRDEAAGRHCTPLPPLRHTPSSPQSQLTASKQHKVQSAQPAFPRGAVVRASSTKKTRKVSVVYPPPPPAEIQQYARRTLPPLPIVNGALLPPRNDGYHLVHTSTTSTMAPSTPHAPLEEVTPRKPITVIVGSRSFAARVANDARFTKATWGIDVRQTSKRDSLTGRIEIEIHGLPDC